MVDKRDVPLSRLILQRLESLQAAGVQQIYRKPARRSHSAPALPASEEESIPPTGPNRRVTPVATHPPGEEVSAIAASLEVLRAEVAACTLCGELAGTRTQTVFGVGNPGARLCVLGEAPGADEDRIGEPFVGAAGQLLNKILAACSLSREEVYILNVLKCRPPGNRNPAPDEAQKCRQFLDRQLQLIQPDFICCLGAVAAQNLLKTTLPIGKMRGELHDYQGIKVLCTYHPAYLLRNPSAKRLAWDDMKLLMKAMGRKVES